MSNIPMSLPPEMEEPFLSVGTFNPDQVKRITRFLQESAIEFEVDIVQPEDENTLFADWPKVELYIRHDQIDDARIVIEVVLESMEA